MPNIQLNLKDRLDNIDKQVCEEVSDGFCQSRLRILIGMWEKGEAIAAVFRGVKTAPTYRGLSRDTSRDDKALKKWHDLYKKYPQKESYLPIAEKQAEEWTTRALLDGGKGSDKVLLSQSNEWWTPKKYIDAVYRVMKKIDLDPASCDEANETIKAKKFYCRKDNGLSHKWIGKVFLNPPYGEEGPPFVAKFIEECINSNITEGIILVNSRATDAEWFCPLFNTGIICFTDHRIDFDSPYEKETSSTHGSCFIYFGPNQEKFAEIFKEFGNVVKRWP